MQPNQPRVDLPKSDPTPKKEELVDLVKDIRNQIVPPTPEPRVVTVVFTANAVCIAKGNNSARFVATPGGAIRDPNAALVLTSVSEAILDTIPIGLNYTIEVRTV